MSIEVLPIEIQNHIAAGEVVERPAHLVKELVENSLDAGSTEITVDFSEGGRRVFVQDNGYGISRLDLTKALVRFATSKISHSDDLWKLNTFGFRGEALASIAAVSDLRLKSKTLNQACSFEVTCCFGKSAEPVEVDQVNGTSIWVENLFENVPARLKFLKSESAEHSQIKAALKAIALSHPQVSFRILESGRLIYLWPPTESVCKRAQMILEVEKLYEGFAERGNVRCRAVFSSPQDIAKTTKNIWIFVQKRWVQDRSLQAAVMEAYRNLLMHGEYPQVVIEVETEPDSVDVNIHPTKSQVKFVDPSLAFRAVQAALRDALEKAPWQRNNSTRIGEDSENFSRAKSEESHQFKLDMSHDIGLRFQSQQKNWSMAEPSLLFAPHESQAKDIHPGVWSRLQVLGQAHLTYILAQDQEKLYLIDQHAAHERVAFEKLMTAWQSGRIDTQEFLFPLVIDLTNDRVEVLEKNQQWLNRLGIYFEKLGPQAIGIKSSPLLLKESALATELSQFSLDLLEQGGSGRMDQLITDLCARMACHSVVRAGQALSLQEMHALLQSMDEFPLSGYCPHGRPVCLEFSFLQLEKDFGRRK